jgi:hypothetical protein
MTSPVLSADLKEGCSGIIRGTRSRWWWLTLACGCVVERRARYGPAVSKVGIYRMPSRSRSDVLPPPRHCRCENQHHKPTSGHFDAPY